MAASTNGNVLAAVADFPQSIVVSTNSGGNWKFTSAPSQPWSAIASSASGRWLTAVVNGGGIYQSLNSGGTWTDTGAPDSSWMSVASSADGSALVAVVNGGGIYVLAAAPVPALGIASS